MTRLFLDIETIPLGEPDPGQVDPPKNYKDPEKILAYQQEHALSDWKKGSLDALRGRVLCIGVAVDERDPVVLHDDDEAALLAGFETNIMALQSRGRIDVVTYNGGAFDRPFLARRAIACGRYALAGWARVRKPWEAGTDLLELWRMGDRRCRGTQADVAAALGIDTADNPISGAEVADRVLAGDLDAVLAHCREDVRELREIWRHMDAAGWTA